MKIAVAGISIECCTFSPLDTGYDDFVHLRGDDILVKFPFLHATENYEVVPIQWSRSVPGGPVRGSAYRRIEEEILTGVRRAMQTGPIDGVYLLMHGAMYVQGMEDAGGGFYAALRAVVGDRCVVGASYDLHGNISERVFEHIDINTAYRRAPHTDAAETRERGFHLLLQVLEESRLPYKAWIPVLMVLPGEVTSTDWQPGRSVYKKIEDVLARPGILDASICIGYVWAEIGRAHV
jgi:microcystin degradation protein MlrC